MKKQILMTSNYILLKVFYIISLNIMKNENLNYFLKTI